MFFSLTFIDCPLFTHKSSQLHLFCVDFISTPFSVEGSGYIQQWNWYSISPCMVFFVTQGVFTPKKIFVGVRGTWGGKALPALDHSKCLHDSRRGDLTLTCFSYMLYIPLPCKVSGDSILGTFLERQVVAECCSVPDWGSLPQDAFHRPRYLYGHLLSDMKGQSWIPAFGHLPFPTDPQFLTSPSTLHKVPTSSPRRCQKMPLPISPAK